MFSDFVRDRPYVVILLLAALSTVPLLSPSLPPLTDLFGHIGRYRVQLDLANDPVLQRYYGFEWALIGNLGVDLLMQVIAPLIGLEPAVKLIVITIIALTTAGFLLLSHEVHGRIGAAAFFALPLAYSAPFQFGFVNYCLSMALAFLAFALWIRLGKTERTGLRLLLFVPISFLIWLAHISGWGALGLFAFAAELTRMRDAGNRWFIAIIKSGLHCMPLAIPVLIMVLSQSGSGYINAEDWFNWATKYEWVITSLRDRWQGFDIASVTVLLLIIVVAIVLADLRFNAILAFAALLLGVTFLIMPRILFGSAYADMRLAPYVIALGVLAIEIKSDVNLWLRRGLIAGGLLFFSARTIATTESFRRFDIMINNELAALNSIPKGARVAALISRGCVPIWMFERRSHIPSFALVRRRAFVNDQFILSGAQLLQIRYKGAVGFDRDPSQFMTGAACVRNDWRSIEQAMAILPRNAFDYIWLIGTPEDKIFDAPRLSAVWRNKGSIVYRIDRQNAAH